MRPCLCMPRATQNRITGAREKRLPNVTGHGKAVLLGHDGLRAELLQRVFLSVERCVHTNVRCGLSRREKRSRPRLMEKPVASLLAVGISCARRTIADKGGEMRPNAVHLLTWKAKQAAKEERDEQRGLIFYPGSTASTVCRSTTPRPFARRRRELIVTSTRSSHLYARTAVLGVFTTASFSRQINICLLVHYGRKPARFLP